MENQKTNSKSFKSNKVAETMIIILAGSVEQKKSRMFENIHSWGKFKPINRKTIGVLAPVAGHRCPAIVTFSLLLKCMSFTIWSLFQLATRPVCSCVMVFFIFFYVMVGWKTQLYQFLFLAHWSVYVHAQPWLLPHLQWAPWPAFSFCTTVEPRPRISQKK